MIASADTEDAAYMATYMATKGIAFPADLAPAVCHTWRMMASV